jgi:WD40 repeat protein
VVEGAELTSNRAYRRTWRVRIFRLDRDTSQISVHDVAFSPDGIRLATCGSGHSAEVWDAVSGQQLLQAGVLLAAFA